MKPPKFLKKRIKKVIIQRSERKVFDNFGKSGTDLKRKENNNKCIYKKYDKRKEPKMIETSLSW